MFLWDVSEIFILEIALGFLSCRKWSSDQRWCRIGCSMYNPPRFKESTFLRWLALAVRILSQIIFMSFWQSLACSVIGRCLQTFCLPSVVPWMRQRRFQLRLVFNLRNFYLFTSSFFLLVSFQTLYKLKKKSELRIIFCVYRLNYS